MKDYSEKRDFHRMQVNSEIEISDSQGNRFKGICRDLSATGMQLYVEQAVNVGEELHTVLHSSSDQFPPLETVCEVISLRTGRRRVPPWNEYQRSHSLNEKRRPLAAVFCLCLEKPQTRGFSETMMPLLSA